MARLCLAAGLIVSTAAAGRAQQDAPEGAVRITKARQAAPVEQTSYFDGNNAASQDMTTFRPTSFHGQTEVVNGPVASESYVVESGDCDCHKCRKFRKTHHFDGDCPDGGKSCFGKHGSFYADKHGNGQGMVNYFACKFGYFIPTGNGGAGAPYFGHYARVYPQDVNHFDQRDGQLYGAQGYGAPIAVPLAPVVGHTYNYGWGVPSSRLTPVSNVAPR